MHISDKERFGELYSMLKASDVQHERNKTEMLNAMLDYISVDNAVIMAVDAKDVVLLTVYIRSFLSTSGYNIGLSECKRMAEATMENLKPDGESYGTQS